MNNTECSEQAELYAGCIDKCPHTFEELTSIIFPTYLAQLQALLANPVPAILFADKQRYRESLAKRLGFAADFSGCYVLQDGKTPIYVGISRGVLNRLRQHLLGEHHTNASLAYAMAKRNHGQLTGSKGVLTGTRASVMGTLKTGTAFKHTQDYLRGLSVGMIPIENPLELYIFEAYAAMALKTADWNTFRTH